jgi:hypothetical protein
MSAPAQPTYEFVSACRVPSRTNTHRYAALYVDPPSESQQLPLLTSTILLAEMIVRTKFSGHIEGDPRAAFFSKMQIDELPFGRIVVKLAGWPYLKKER